MRSSSRIGDPTRREPEKKEDPMKVLNDSMREIFEPGLKQWVKQMDAMERWLLGKPVGGA